MKKYIKAILNLTTVGILFYINYDQRDQIKLYKQRQQLIDSLTTQVDSLRDELFNSSTEIGRYELTQEHLKEVNPKAEKQFEEYYNHETE